MENEGGTVSIKAFNAGFILRHNHHNDKQNHLLLPSPSR
ncbi:hypothetical protein BGS_1222 [Beggiatoa sp. SS]|nr:hypothetical protein BGS_1222 [Beggiatoa sp. SS]